MRAQIDGCICVSEAIMALVVTGIPLVAVRPAYTGRFDYFAPPFGPSPSGFIIGGPLVIANMRYGI